MARLNLPYGIDDFEKVRTSDCYYIDKTGFISELLSETFSVNLITRPRRFGKTLTMRMLAEFFDIRKNGKELFTGLEVSGDKELCAKWMNQWPSALKMLMIWFSLWLRLYVKNTGIYLTVKGFPQPIRKGFPDCWSRQATEMILKQHCLF